MGLQLNSRGLLLRLLDIRRSYKEECIEHLKLLST